MFTFRDVAGNTGEIEAKVDWIDTALPTAKVSYTPDILTSGNVVVMLILNKTGTVL
jgi:hypothetical protein